MDIDRLKRIADHESVILVGPNGAGKSRALKLLCQKLSKSPGASVAISNTPFARLPSSMPRRGYAHIKISAATIDTLLERLLWTSLEERSFSLVSMREVLEYTGYLPALGIEITPARKLPRGRPSRAARNDDAVRIARSIERYYGRHLVDLSDSSFFYSTMGDIARIPFLQSQINTELRYAEERSIEVRFSLIKNEGDHVPLDHASSGQLTLLTTAMFILSRRETLTQIFVDEPENSLHPHWQVNYFEFLTNMLRRENVRFYVATHSAVLANGALTGDLPVRIIKCNTDGSFEEIKLSKKNADESIEKLLWEAFDTVTPVNNYLSEAISQLVWDVRDGKVTKNSALAQLDDFVAQSFSDQQREFLAACRDIIKAVDV